MGDSVTKQAVPVAFFEQLRTDEKLLTLFEQLLNCGGGMSSWFTTRTVTSFGTLPSPVDAIKQNYKHWGALEYSPFDSEADLEASCTFLEQRLAQLQADDPLLAKRRVLLESRLQELLYRSLAQALVVKFPALEAQFAHRVIWGGAVMQSGSSLRYLLPDRVSTIAQVLDEIEVDEWLCYFDAAANDSQDWLEACRNAIQTFKHCFTETAQRSQILLTKVG